MNNRLKELRNYLNLSQEEFGKRINLSKPTISAFETETRAMTDRVISDICSQFNVNEDWLRDGEGEMFVETKESFISGLSKQYDLDDLDRAILESYISLSTGDRAIIKKYIQSISASLNDEIATTTDGVPEENQSIAEDEETYIQKELDAYRLELEAEKKGKISSVSEGIEEKAN